MNESESPPAPGSTPDKARVGDGPHAVEGRYRRIGPGRFTVALDRGAGRPALGVPTTVAVDSADSVVQAEVTRTAVIGSIVVCTFVVTATVRGPGIDDERRGSHRIEPESVVEVLVRSLADDHRSESRVGQPGVLGDLSGGGCGLSMSLAAYATMGAIDAASIWIELPPPSRPVTITAELTNSHREPEHVWLGFRWRADDANDEALRVIDRFLGAQDRREQLK